MAPRLQRAMWPPGWAGEAPPAVLAAVSLQGHPFFGRAAEFPQHAVTVKLFKRLFFLRKTPPPSAGPSLPSISRVCTRRAPIPAARAGGWHRSPQYVQAPPDARALPVPSSPPWGNAPIASCELKKQTQPFFPVVFPVCLRNIIFPQNEKNNNNLQEGPKHEPVCVRFQSKQALKNKFLRYSSHV